MNFTNTRLAVRNGSEISTPRFQFIITFDDIPLIMTFPQLALRWIKIQRWSAPHAVRTSVRKPRNTRNAWLYRRALGRSALCASLMNMGQAGKLLFLDSVRLSSIRCGVVSCCGESREFECGPSGAQVARPWTDCDSHLRRHFWDPGVYLVVKSRSRTTASWSLSHTNDRIWSLQSNFPEGTLFAAWMWPWCHTISVYGDREW